MLRSLWMLVIYCAFLVLGLQAPFAFALGYIWVDAFSPQNVAYVILNQIPVSFIMGAAAFGGYLVLDRKFPPRLNLITAGHVWLALWATMTMIWAVRPDLAWDKWDWAFKTLMFSAFLPFVIRSRVQFEAMLLVFLFSLAANIIPFGAKVTLSGGGYGQQLGLAGANYGLGEGSTLAGVAVMTIPIALYFRKYGILLPKHIITNLLYLALCLAAVMTAVGTFERTAIIGFMVLALSMVAKSRHKILTILVVAAVGAAIIYTSSSGWEARVSTIGSYENESSAMGRLEMWKWTLGYVMSHPFGGGFNMYVISVLEEGNGRVEYGKAFHSIYFEMLGELGWPGLLTFLAMLIGAQFKLQMVARRVKNNPDLEWCAAAAAMLQVSLAVISACGAFIGIAFQPTIHYLLAATVTLCEYVRRANANVAEPTGNWRERVAIPVQAGPTGTGPSQPGATIPGWRARAPVTSGQAEPRSSG